MTGILTDLLLFCCLTAREQNSGNYERFRRFDPRPRPTATSALKGWGSHERTQEYLNSAAECLNRKRPSGDTSLIA